MLNEQKMKKTDERRQKFTIISVGLDWYTTELLLKYKSMRRQIGVWRVWPKKTSGRINKYSQDLPIDEWKIATWEAGHAQKSLY